MQTRGPKLLRQLLSGNWTDTFISPNILLHMHFATCVQSSSKKQENTLKRASVRHNHCFMSSGGSSHFTTKAFTCSVVPVWMSYYETDRGVGSRSHHLLMKAPQLFSSLCQKHRWGAVWKLCIPGEVSREPLFSMAFFHPLSRYCRCNFFTCRWHSTSRGAVRVLSDLKSEQHFHAHYREQTVRILCYFEILQQQSVKTEGVKQRGVIFSCNCVIHPL